MGFLLTSIQPTAHERPPPLPSPAHLPPQLSPEHPPPRRSPERLPSPEDEQLAQLRSLVEDVVCRYDAVARRVGRERLRTDELLGFAIPGKSDSILDALQAKLEAAQRSGEAAELHLAQERSLVGQLRQSAASAEHDRHNLVESHRLEVSTFGRIVADLERKVHEVNARSHAEVQAKQAELDTATTTLTEVVAMRTALAAQLSGETARRKEAEAAAVQAAQAEAEACALQHSAGGALPSSGAFCARASRLAPV